MSEKFFRYADMLILSQVAFPELFEVRLDSPSKQVVRFEKANDLRDAIQLQVPFHSWITPEGTEWVYFYKLDSGYLISIVDCADFLITPKLNLIQYSSDSRLPASTLRHLLLDTALPFFLSLTKNLVFHGSVISNEKKCIAFLGDSGAGKSSLAAHFCDNGWELLSDDIVLLDSKGQEFIATPTYPSIRLWPDMLPSFANSTQTHDVSHFNSKKRVPVAFNSTPQKLDTIYLLKKDGMLENIVVDLVSCSFLLDTDSSSLSAHFRQLTQLTKRLSVSYLDYQHSPIGLQNVLDHCSPLS